MKVLCKYSGLSFTCEHFPGTLDRGETCHPIFLIPQKRLLSYLGKWSSGHLPPTDSYLLFLALLNSSEQIYWRTSAFRTDKTDSIVSQNMEYLARTLPKLNSVRSPSKTFPSFAIGSETADLSNVHYWIEAWESEYKSFQTGYVARNIAQKIESREAALERLIKNPFRNSLAFSRQLAEWASVAGSFPTFLIKSPFTGLPQPVSDYWKLLIQKAAGETSLYTIPSNDLAELLEHCEENIEAGSIHAHALFTHLRNAITKQKSYLGFGDKDSPLTLSYAILSSSDDVEAANLRVAIESAPTIEPKPEDYPTRFAYLKAKCKYDMARKYGAI
jgi:hypothetical protein